MRSFSYRYTARWGGFRPERGEVPGSTPLGTHSGRYNGREHKKGDTQHSYGHPRVQRVRVQGDSLSAASTINSRAKSRTSGRWDSLISADPGGGHALTWERLAHSAQPVREVPRCRGQIRLSAPFAAPTRPSSLRPPTPPATAASKLRGEHDTPKDSNLTAPAA